MNSWRVLEAQEHWKRGKEPTGVPNWMQFSSVRTKSESESLMMWRLLAFSMFLIHLLAWPWGSIINGQRRELLKTSQPPWLHIWAKLSLDPISCYGDRRNLSLHARRALILTQMTHICAQNPKKKKSTSTTISLKKYTQSASHKAN